MRFDQFLAEQCAPVLAGLKPGSLFPYKPQPNERIQPLLRHWNHALSPKGVALTSVKRCRRTGAYLFYVYRPGQIGAILRQPDVEAFLSAYGYAASQTIPQALQLLTRRMCTQQEFPHEIGIFLGYPLHDVLGFLAHQGKNCLFTGCWKVYAEPDKAKALFRRFQQCTQHFREQFRQGLSVAELTVAA